MFILGKIIYRNLCEEIPKDIQTQWLKCITNLKAEIKIPRSIPIKNEPVTEIDIHLFSDASTDGVRTVVVLQLTQ